MNNCIVPTLTKENHNSFLNRLRPFLSDSDIDKIDFAYGIAKYGHMGQFRESGERYFEHLRSATLIIIDELHIFDPTIIISALLHDILEDSFLLKEKWINIIFGKEISEIISAVTKPKDDDPRFSTNDDRLIWYYQQLWSANPKAKLVKLADRLHNIRSSACLSAEKRNRKINETILIYLPLAKELITMFPKAAEYLSSELRSTISRLEAQR